MVKKVSPVKNPAQSFAVTGWRAVLIQILQIFISGLQSIQRLVEKTAPSMTEANNLVTTIGEKIGEEIGQTLAVKSQDETIEKVAQVLTEIADQSEKNLGEVTSEVFASIDSNIEKVQENLSDIKAIDLTVEATKKIEAVKDSGKKNINSFQQTKQKITSIWQNLIFNIRPLLSKSWQEKLSDSMISALMTTTLITILVVSIVIGAALIPMTPSSIALEQTDQNIILDNNDIGLQPINTDNIPRSDITPDSDRSNISEGDLTKNSDESAIKPKSNQANTQIALVDEVSENTLTNNLTNNSELPEVNKTPIEDYSQDQLNQEKPNTPKTIDDLVIDNSIADNNIVDQVSENTEATLAIDQEKVDKRSLNTEIKGKNIELDTQDNQLDNQSSQTTDNISAPDTGIANKTIKDSENIESNELASEPASASNNLTDSLTQQEKSNNDSIKNENISAPVQQIIPTELTTEPDLPVEKTQVEPEPVKFTPEQYLVISIKNQIADITNRYGGGMVDSIQVNFLSGLLVIQVTDDWYDLDKTAQNQLANNLFKQAQDLDFTKLQIADTTGKLVARSPVVGEQMIILARSQSAM